MHYLFRPSFQSTTGCSLLSILASLALLLPTTASTASTASAKEKVISGATPYGALPTAGQLSWQDMEMYAFTHFTTNTFTGKEWGFGDESPNVFHPTDYNPEQIVKTLAEAGFKGVVLTCKHHDGFCLWPTKTTKHSVASSQWQNGKGDVVRDFAKACKKFGVKFGVYVSPWDRNNPNYGTAKYLDIYRQQLKELLTQYGPIFLVWHDGANGGDGYYGGKREKRSIDRSTYYKWPETWAMVKKLQPKAVIFSDVGPDTRWVGNESGIAGVPCWATYTPRSNDGKTPAPGTVIYQDGEKGTVNGKYWIPAEADVSIRPGWFWHANENDRVRTPENLLELYFNSVGRGANFNLNVPPDQRGQIHEKDRESLKGFSNLLKRLYSTNYADGAIVSASSSLSGTKPANILNRQRTSFWMANKQDKQATLTIKLPKMRTFDVVRLAEPTQLGQRIRQFSIKIKKDGTLVPWIEGSSIGMRSILRAQPVTTDELQLTIDKADAPPALSELSLWKQPRLLTAPTISSDNQGAITLSNTPDITTRYTLDGTEPTPTSAIYQNPIALPQGGTIKAVNYSGEEPSATTSYVAPVASATWKVIQAESSASAPERAIDGDTKTLWHTHGANGELPPPQSIDIDMGQEIPVSGISYTPRQDGNINGIVSQYSIYLSSNGKDWGTPVAQGEFSNIKSNPIRQIITLAQPQKARYLRFIAKDVVSGKHVSIAELGVFSHPLK
ncbi:MAG: alpha-L-fucosidase [Akkermansia sp.]